MTPCKPTFSGQNVPFVLVLTSPERSASFKRKLAAEQFLAQVEVEQRRGAWVDPRLGKTTMDDGNGEWWSTQTHLGPSTRARDESYVRNHISPTSGPMPLSGVHHTLVQSWVSDLAARRARATVHKAHQIRSKIMQGSADGDDLFFAAP
ncbi:MAG: hypothetical protein ACR2OH_01230 [Microthrixaceae bacterium]